MGEMMTAFVMGTAIVITVAVAFLVVTWMFLKYRTARRARDKRLRMKKAGSMPRKELHG